MYKHLVLAILALIGVLAPCVIEMNINSTHIQETAEYIDLEIEYAQQEASEVAACVLAQGTKKEKTNVVKIAQTKQRKKVSETQKIEKRQTYLFYGRVAGGMPNMCLSAA